MKPIHILIIDDHAMVREGLSMALQLQSDFHIVGQARSGTEGVQLAQSLKPDLVLLDLNMPDLDGIAVTHRLKEQTPQTRILILSGIHSDARVSSTVQAGVDGYIVKDATTSELSHAIRQVASGEAYFHPLITQALVRVTRKRATPSQPPEETLTARELDVLKMMLTSATNRVIAESLHISEETVRTHVKHILRKLNQSNRTQAVIEAVRRGIISIE